MLGFAWNIITKTPFNAVKPKPYGCRLTPAGLTATAFLFFKRQQSQAGSKHLFIQIKLQI
jgi:hypothetical protein